MDKRTNAQIATDLDKVRRALKSTKSGGLSRGQLVAQTGLERGAVAYSLARLREDGEVLLEGDKSFARYYHRENRSS